LKPNITLSSPQLSKKATKGYWLRDIKTFFSMVFMLLMGGFWVSEIVLHMANHFVGYYNIFIYFTLIYIFVIIFFTKISTWLYMGKYNASISSIIFLAFLFFTPIWTIFIVTNTFIHDDVFYSKVFRIEEKHRCDLSTKSRVKRYCFDLKSAEDNVVFRVLESDYDRYKKEDIITIKVKKSFLGFEIVKHLQIGSN